MANTVQEIVLAIDPGYDRCGVAYMTKDDNKTIVLFSDCVTSSKENDHYKRVYEIYKAIEASIDTYKPTCIAIETLFFSVNKSTAMRVAEVRGALFTLAGTHQIPLIEVSPQAIKIALTGAGNATKSQVQKMVSLTITNQKNDKLDDEIDAIALGATALEILRVENRKKALAK